MRYMEERNIEEKGMFIGVYMPKRLYELCEETRKKLGMNRSRFYQYCIIKTLQELNVLSNSLQRGGELTVKV